jgi:hypothetical protein
MMIKVDADGREFIINTDAISCVIPDDDEDFDALDKETHFIQFKGGGHFPITHKEFTQIAEKIEQEQRTGT